MTNLIKQDPDTIARHKRTAHNGSRSKDGNSENTPQVIKSGPDIGQFRGPISPTFMRNSCAGSFNL